MSAQSKRQYMTWLKSRHPVLYRQVVGFTTGQNLGLTTAEMIAEQDAFASGGNYGYSADQSVWEKALDTAVDAVGKWLPAYGAIYSQKQLIKLNLERAKAGLPPLDQNAVATQVNVGVSSDVKILLYIGLAVGAGLLIFKMNKRR